MKKILAIIVATAMLLLLVACNNSTQTETTNNPTTEDTTQKETTTSGTNPTTEETTTEEETTTIDPKDVTYTFEVVGNPFYPDSTLYKIAYVTRKGSDGSVDQGCIIVEWNTDAETAEFIDVYVDHVGTEIPVYAIGKGVLVNKTTDGNGKVVLNPVNVKTVIIPDSVIEIRDGAFDMMSGIESIQFGNGVRNIGKFAFEGLHRISEINLPESLLTIQESAFFGCTSVKTLVIPDSVIEIGEGAFLGCRSLESISIPERFKDSMDVIFGVLPSNVTITYTSGE